MRKQTMAASRRSAATRLDDGWIGVLYASRGEDKSGVSGFNVHFAGMNLACLRVIGAKERALSRSAARANRRMRQPNRRGM